MSSSLSLYIDVPELQQVAPQIKISDSSHATLTALSRRSKDLKQQGCAKSSRVLVPDHHHAAIPCFLLLPAKSLVQLSPDLPPRPQQRPQFIGGVGGVQELPLCSAHRDRYSVPLSRSKDRSCAQATTSTGKERPLCGAGEPSPLLLAPPSPPPLQFLTARCWASLSVCF